ncbi:MAG: hypothetical protein CM1200mP10_08530 [Candidatus Neomarinimicrobiota bacterium]|nr:MAG: hypothetical protein CM1200mP10_08530 [Candidatus Neomarinimicrobiota bacterium]
MCNQNSPELNIDQFEITLDSVKTDTQNSINKTPKHRLTHKALTLISGWLRKRTPAIQYRYAHKLAQIFYNHLIIRQKEARKNFAKSIS